jgi:hypothetical protein
LCICSKSIIIESCKISSCEMLKVLNLILHAWKNILPSLFYTRQTKIIFFASRISLSFYGKQKKRVRKYLVTLNVHTKLAQTNKEKHFILSNLYALAHMYLDNSRVIPVVVSLRLIWVVIGLCCTRHIPSSVAGSEV